jgi:hypothetical protein
MTTHEPRHAAPDPEPSTQDTEVGLDHWVCSYDVSLTMCGLDTGGNTGGNTGGGFGVASCLVCQDIAEACTTTKACTGCSLAMRLEP